jgi:hypothetical protein
MMRKIFFFLFFFILIISPGHIYQAMGTPATDPTNACYPWQGDRDFCNWHNYSQAFSRGPYSWSTTDYCSNLVVHVYGAVYHLKVQIAGVYYYNAMQGKYLIIADCAGGAPAVFNDQDWTQDYSTDEYFQTCDTCYYSGSSNNRLKWMLYCHPVDECVYVTAVPNTGTPDSAATTMMAWLNNETDMFLPFDDPPHWVDPPGVYVRYSKRMDPDRCN